MEIHLTPEQEAFVKDAIANGRLHSAEEAVAQALKLWEERERTRLEILSALDEAEADIEAGRYIEVSEDTHQQFVEDLKREAREMYRRKVTA